MNGCQFRCGIQSTRPQRLVIYSYNIKYSIKYIKVKHKCDAT